MIAIDFGVINPMETRRKLEAGYRGRRNFLILELFSAIVYQTPVKTGLARGNWQITIGAPPSGTLTRRDTHGDTVIMEELGVLKGASPFATIHIGNALHYIDDLEEGSSTQAPEGILRVVVPAYRSMYGDLI